MAFTSVDSMIAASPGIRRSLHKTGFSPQAAASWVSLWSVAGIPGAGATPSSGVAGDVPTVTTAGAIVFVNPSGGNETRVGRLSVYAKEVGTLLLYDRLLHNSGISATLTSGQTLNTTALTRPDANAADVEAWWQVYGVMGAGVPTVTLSYTDQDGNTGQSASSGVLPTTLAANRTGPFQLAAGDTGVRSVQTWTNSATFTSGTISLVLRRLIAALPLTTSNTGRVADGIEMGLPRVYDSACLEFVWFASSTSTHIVGGGIALIQG